MLKYIAFLCFSFVFNQVIFSQDIKATHNIEFTGESNEYNITTTISGLEGVDIARVTYFISKEHTYKASPNNSLFSNRDEKFIKYYVMAVPASGILNIELGVVLSKNENYSFPVEFQYSKNEEKKIIQFSPITIKVATTNVDNNTIVQQETKNAEEQKLKKETELLAAKQKEQEQLAQEKAEQETKNAEEQKLKKEAELLAAKQKEQERLAQEKAEQETKNAEEQKLKKEAELLAAKQKEQERLAQEKAEQETKNAENDLQSKNIKYTVQIFALSKYSEQKIVNFCAKNNLYISNISTEKINGLTKVRYGSASSIEEAKALRKSLLNKNISGAFIVKIK